MDSLLYPQFPRDNVRKISITRYEAHKSSPRVASPFGLLEIQAAADGGDVRSKNFSECITLIARKQARKDFETSLRSQPHRFLPHTGFASLCLSRFQAKPICSTRQHRPPTNTLVVRPDAVNRIY